MLPLLLCLLFPIVHCRYYDETAWDMASQYILETMVPDQDPCDNFYNYACGKWDCLGKNSKNEILHSEQITKDLIKKAIKQIDTSDPNMPKFKKSLAVFYNQCIAKNVSVSDTLYQLFTGIGKLIGFPPLLAKNKEEAEKVRTKNVWYLLGQVQKELDLGVLFEINTLNAVKQCRHNEVTLKLQSVQQEKDAVNYYTIIKFAELFGAKQGVKIDQATLERKLRAMAEFVASLRSYENETNYQKEMLRSNTTDSDYTSSNRHVMSETMPNYSDLLKLYPHIEWDQYFKGLLSMDQLTLLQEGRIKIYITNEIYFANLHRVMKANSTESALNYIYWVVMTKHYYSNRLTLEKAENSIDQEALCFKTTLETFGPAVARAMFDANKWNATEWQISIELLKESIFGAFRFLVQSAHWLSKEEKLAMITKSNKVAFYPGIPYWLNNDAVLNYKTFEFESEYSFPENMLRMKQKIFQQRMDRVFLKENPNNPRDEDVQFKHNAVYNPYMNTIDLFLGAVVPPHYHIAYPVSLNYGMLGQMIGHELFHAFNNEDEPLYYAPCLNREFSKETLKNIKNCLIQQYSNFCYDQENMCIKGKRTLYENMADIDGLKVAYMAYKFTTQTGGSEPHLPKLIKLTDDQIFFLAYARGACGNKKVDLEEVHAPANSRIEVPIRNFQEAAAKFGCAMGKPLALVDRCDIYGNYRPMDQCTKQQIVIPED